MSSDRKRLTIPRIVDLERSLGIKCAVQGQLNRVVNTPLLQLQESVWRLGRDLTGLSLSDLRSSKVATDEYDVVFEKLGPAIWPNDTSRFKWLADAREQNFGGLWRQNLYFSIATDRTRLRCVFRIFMGEKVVSYQTCHRIGFARNGVQGLRKIEARTYAMATSTPGILVDTNLLKAVSSPTSSKRSVSSDLEGEAREQTVLPTSLFQRDSPRKRFRPISMDSASNTSATTKDHSVTFPSEVMVDLTSEDDGTEMEADPGVHELADISDPASMKGDEKLTYEGSHYSSKASDMSSVQELAVEQVLADTVLEIQFDEGLEEQYLVSLKDCWGTASLFAAVEEEMPRWLKQRDKAIERLLVRLPGSRVIALRPGGGVQFQLLVKLLMKEWKRNETLAMHASVEWASP